jgi:hypothetical protein
VERCAFFRVTVVEGQAKVVESLQFAKLPFVAGDDQRPLVVLEDECCKRKKLLRFFDENFMIWFLLLGSIG